MTLFSLLVFKKKKFSRNFYLTVVYEEKFAIIEKSVQRKREFHYDATCRKIAQKNARRKFG
ncbi:hypothetical protein ACODQN_14360, partial [Mammaliicoccus sciuri]